MKTNIGVMFSLLCSLGLLQMRVMANTPQSKLDLYGQMKECSSSLKDVTDDKKGDELMLRLRKSVAQKVFTSPDDAQAEIQMDTLEFLESVLRVMHKPEEAGKALASLLMIPADQVGALSSYADLERFKKPIADMVDLRRLKNMGVFYDYAAMERSIQRLMKDYGSKYPQGEAYLKKIAELKDKYPDPNTWIATAGVSQRDEIRALIDFRLQALVKDNPEMNFDKMLYVRRYSSTGQKTHHQSDKPWNYHGLTMPEEGMYFYSEILERNPKIVGSEGERLYANDRWLGFTDLNFDGDKLLMTSNRFNKDNRRPWDIFELDLKTKICSPLTETMPTDTDSYDGCYLPDGRVMFINTSGYHGVPCDDGNPYVGNIHLLDRKNDSVRRLCLDQDNNYSPTLLPDGRVMYLRWEYTESAHYFSRILMHMNPDGTDQKEYYGSNSYWPNTLFGAKPIPDKPGMFVAIVSGHHGTKRVGELIVFDINRGRVETEGAVQKIPGYGKPVENIMMDNLVDGISTPYFNDPYPLSACSFLASSTLTPGNPVMNLVYCDVFDNIVPLTGTLSMMYGEPRPLKAKKKPPVIPDRVDLSSSKATVYIANVNEGRAMKGVPKGKAKKLRVFMSEYSPRHFGSHYAMGIESNWDLKVLYGTANVEADGSAVFEVPANQPITVQVLDENDRALALMRSWFTAMPGERLSCIGCHETQDEAPPVQRTIASRKKPEQLTPWFGPARTFSFLNEVQPVLDKNCISCHNGEKEGLPNFASTEPVQGNMAQRISRGHAPGSVSYYALHPYVRRNGPEGNYKGLEAGEFFVDTSELVQLLQKGHHGVQLDKEDWNRLYTWIDMNTPYLGYWPGDVNEQRLARRYDLHSRFTTIKKDYAVMYDYLYKRKETKEIPELVACARPLSAEPMPKVEGFPFVVNNLPEVEELDMGNNVTMKFRKLPAGKFLMGSQKETPAEAPVSPVEIISPFSMAETEVTLEQYRQFDPNYENGWYDMHWKDQVRPGYNMDENPKYPAIRVTWSKAMEFCSWLSKKTGKKVTLPTEAQWEYAARAGTDTSLPYGNVDVNFSKLANLADVSLKKMAVYGIDPQPIKDPDSSMDFVPSDAQSDDGFMNLAPVGTYQPNAFGLYDMIGNAAEWTRSEYRPYPWKADGRNENVENADIERAVRGGSWRDRPQRATSSWRWKYPAWRKVHNVGFRVIIED